MISDNLSFQAAQSSLISALCLTAQRNFDRSYGSKRLWEPN